MNVFRKILFILLSTWFGALFFVDNTDARPAVTDPGTFFVTGELQDPYRSEYFQVEGVPTLDVHTLSGNIEVVYNPDLEGVQVDLYVSRGFSFWPGRRSLENYRIIIQQRGDRIIASVEDRRSGGVGRDAGGVEFHFVIQVPRRASTNLRNLHGEIWLEGVEGSHFLQNESGGMRVRKAEGEIRAASTSGNLELDQLVGQVHARTVSGHIQSIGNEGEIRLRTISGNVSVTEMTGVLAAATTSGNLDADLIGVSSGIYMEAVSGNIRLGLPSDSGFQIRAKAMGYDFGGLNPSEFVEETRSDGEKSITLRGGGVPVSLSTLSGRVTLTESQ